MAREYKFEVIGDSDWELLGTRSFKVYFSEPENEWAEPPGILLLIAGYGGEAGSRVYQKMRSTFADEYNLYVVQCNYMGWEFMQSEITQKEIDSAINTSAETERRDIVADIEEIETNYNDMGPFQALDNILAVRSLMDIIKANGKTYNESRICAYGHSHGAYLAHLCNCFFPGMFTDILDNSSWIYPIYLDAKEHRVQDIKIGNVRLVRHFFYRIMEEAEDKEVYDLMGLYPQFENKARILCFHGEKDTLVSSKSKINLFEEIKNSQIRIIKETDVDNEIFKSANHGLDADFLKLFQYAVENYHLLESKAVNGGGFEGNILTTSKYVYGSRMNEGIPEIYRRALD